jgi:hypothetical protein
MKRLVLAASLVLASFGARAQDLAATRYVRYDRIPLQAVPGNGQDALTQISAGDSVEVLRAHPGTVPHVDESTTKQYIYVRHAAQQGWIMRMALVSSRDSVTTGRTVVATSKPVGDGSGRYVPVTEAKRPYAAGGKVVRVVATGEHTPLPSGYTRHKTQAGHSYITGPRGGCFYLNASGNKVYVDHSYCR